MIKQGIRKIVEQSGYQIYRSENILFVPEYILLKAYFSRAVKLIHSEVNTIFDVGANVGRFSNFASSLFPKAKVFAFEPVADTFKELQANAGKNTNIYPFNMAMGAAKQDQKKIFLKKDPETNSLANNETWIQDENKFEFIRVDTIDRVMADQKIQSIEILKTDTEGYDLEVLKGADKALSESRVKVIVCEVGFDEKDLQHSFFNRIQQYLFDKGFRVFGFTGLEACGTIQHKTGISYCNCIFLNADN